MFDVGFLELVVIMVLGLLVLGPERLPKAAQKAGYWFGKARRYVEGMKSQVEAEFDTSEVKRLLHNQEVKIKELQNKITESGDSINDALNTDLRNGALDNANLQSADLENDFDDDDPGSSHEEAATQATQSAKPSAPQYDIIEQSTDWDDEVNEPQTNQEASTNESAVSNKAQ